MSVQDRNANRDSVFIQKELTTGEIATIVAADKDEVQFMYRSRFNFRLLDALFSCGAVGVAAAELRACIGKELSVVGAPQFGNAGAAVTFTIEAMEQIDVGVMTPIAITAAQAFGHVAEILSNSWGVFTVQIDGAQAITTKPGALTMAYATEEEAIKNAPAPDAANGLVAVLTMEIATGPFICATTNTDAAMVTAFNTIDRGGHYITAPVLATFAGLQATLAQRLKVAGVGNLIGEVDDWVIITARSVGNATFDRGFATAVIRKTPAQGEGVEASTGLSRPFVP